MPVVFWQNSREAGNVPDGWLPDETPLFEPSVNGGLGDAKSFVVGDIQTDLPRG